MSKKHEKVAVTITLDRDVLEAIDETAKALRVTRSAYLNMVCSGARDANEAIEKALDKWFERKKSEIMAKLEIPSRTTRRGGVK
jgi:predicted transcriptional regulator